MAGKLIRGIDGKVHPIAGAAGDAPIDIHEDEIIGEFSESFGGPIEENKNKFRLTLAHSAQNNGEPRELPAFVDTETQKRDGQPRRDENGAIVYDTNNKPINDPSVFEQDYGSNLVFAGRVGCDTSVAPTRA